MVQTKEERRAKQKEWRNRPENKAKKQEYQKKYNSRQGVKAQQKAYREKPEVKAKQKMRDSRPERKAQQKAYRQTPEVKARQKERNSRPEVKARQKEWSNRPENRKKQKDGRDNIRFKVLQYYSKVLSKSDVPCCRCCGESHIDFLALDHIAGKKVMDSETELLELGYSSKKSGGTLNRWIRDNNFPKGFQTLCHNCNQAKGYSRDNKCHCQK